MDISSSLQQAPVAEALPISGAQDSRDSRVEESGALSFSGLLQKNQERPVPTQQGGQTEAKPESAGQGASVEGSAAGPDQGPAMGQPTATVPDQLSAVSPVDRPVMIGQMLKIQMAAYPINQEMTTAAISDSSSSSGSAVASAMAEPGDQAEIQPTGGDGKPPSAIILPGLQAPETATAQGAAKVAVPATQQGAQSQASVPSGAQELPLPTADIKPTLTVQAEASAAQEKPVAEDPLKPAGSPARSLAASVRADQVLPSSDSRGLDQVHLKKVAMDQVMPAAQAPEDENSAEDEANLSDQTREAVAFSASDSESSANEVKATAASASAAVDAQPQVSADLPEGLLFSELETGAASPRVSLNTPSTDARTAALEQGRQIRQQVIRELSSGMNSRVGSEKITLQLNPEKLGQVEIQFSGNRNDLNIVITASNPEAEQAIREGIKELAEGIADKSARWQQVDIKVDQRGQGQEKNDSRQEKNRDQSRREDGHDHRQEKQNQSHDGKPDWASLRQEG